MKTIGSRVFVQYSPSSALKFSSSTLPLLSHIRRSIVSCTAQLELQQRRSSISESALTLKTWLEEEHKLADADIKLLSLSDGRPSGFRAIRPVSSGEVLLKLPAELGITKSDVKEELRIAHLADGRSELVCLALWLINEKGKGRLSAWQAFLDTLPLETDSPILWEESDRKLLLRGSPVLDEASSRAAAIDAEWESIAKILAEGPEQLSQGIFNKQAFRNAMAVVLAHAAYLESAQCFALLPAASLLDHTSQEDAAHLDFDLDTQCVVIQSRRNYREDESIAIYDGRSNGELFLATGILEDANPADNLVLTVSLVKADRLFSAKKSVLESLGLGTQEQFPIYKDRMPLQLLAYLRLSRVQDPAQLAMVSFERDVVINQNNEYEILQLLMGDCRERLSNYPGSIEDCVKKLQQRDLSSRERLATRLLLSEQRILQGTVDAVRRRLAPIRGIPTKSGAMADPNEDLKDIFSTIENLPQAPARLFGGLMSWARGEQDPDWNKRGRKPNKRQR